MMPHTCVSPASFAYVYCVCVSLFELLLLHCDYYYYYYCMAIIATVTTLKNIDPTPILVQMFLFGGSRDHTNKNIETTI